MKTVKSMVLSIVAALVACGGGGDDASPTPISTPEPKLVSFTAGGSSSAKPVSTRPQLVFEFDKPISSGICSISPSIPGGNCTIVISADGKSLAIKNGNDDYVFHPSTEYKISLSNLQYKYQGFDRNFNLAEQKIYSGSDPCLPGGRQNYYGDCIYPIYGNRQVDETGDLSDVGDNYWNQSLYSWVAKEGVAVTDITKTSSVCSTVGDECWLRNIANQNIKLIQSGMIFKVPNVVFGSVLSYYDKKVIFAVFENSTYYNAYPLLTLDSTPYAFTSLSALSSSKKIIKAIGNQSTILVLDEAGNCKSLIYDNFFTNPGKFYFSNAIGC